MRGAANTADIQDEILEDRLRLLDVKVRELKTIWKLVDDTAFEHLYSNQLRLALLEPAFQKMLEAESGQSMEVDEPAATSEPEALTASETAQRALGYGWRFMTHLLQHTQRPCPADLLTKPGCCWRITKLYTSFGKP